SISRERGPLPANSGFRAATSSPRGYCSLFNHAGTDSAHHPGGPSGAVLSVIVTPIAFVAVVLEVLAPILLPLLVGAAVWSLLNAVRSQRGGRSAAPCTPSARPTRPRRSRAQAWYRSLQAR